MKTNITDQQYFGANLQLSEPHFDEEATLLSARPVVPLGDVSASVSSGRRLAFGLAMVVAVMVGAFGATLIYKQGSQEQATTILETATPFPTPGLPEDQLLSGAGGAISESQAFLPAGSVDDVATPETHNNGATNTRRSSPRSSQSVRSGRANETWQVAADNQQDERTLRRAERMEARRLRRNAGREAKPEVRGEKSRSADNLLRIREIFEGSPRP